MTQNENIKPWEQVTIETLKDVVNGIPKEYNKCRILVYENNESVPFPIKSLGMLFKSNNETELKEDLLIISGEMPKEHTT